jgi:hypothetical protein
MDKLQIKQLQVLEETVKYYSENTERRCVKGSCTYAPENSDKASISNGCAVGRLLEPDLRLNLDEMFSSGDDSGVSNEYLFSLLPEKVRNLGMPFLTDLQVLHDDNSNWSAGEGLTVSGEGYAQTMGDRIKGGLYIK